MNEFSGKLKSPVIDWVGLLIGLSVLVNLSGIFITILGPDGALYASIAKRMVQRNDYVNLFAEGKDWLDKPHFPFWVTAFSFRVFGFTTWAYKLPAILFLFAGGWYTYCLAKKLYNRTIARWSVLIFFTAEHIIISNNDVRAEPYLTGLIVGSLYYFFIASTENNKGALFIGSVLAACAVMTKGPFALIPIVTALGAHFLLKKRYRDLFHSRWLIAALLILIFILPELYCLYVQFDAHPEKLVFGRTQVSGIQFFFWDSQFGRFFNTGPIKGKGDLFFFFHTLLWAFVPWSLLLYAAFVHIVRKHWRNPFLKHEWLTIGGATCTLLLFSLSRFQLPHYANIVYPLLSIVLAAYLHEVKSEKTWRVIRITQSIIIVLIIIAVSGLHVLYKPAQLNVSTVVIILPLVVILILSNKFPSLSNVQLILWRTVLSAAILNFYLNLNFYPDLLQYQSGSQAAIYA
ncbi:MAG: glycosyltransferase family 39 protein, partial [Chitinophagaceae bacterium]|nr:glycosyltransferase family 39 protein [Chitinophagaceae bacterium]